MFRRQFPRRRALAGLKPYNRPTDANRLAGFQFKIAGQAVAFVEKTQCRHPFSHRRANLFGHRFNQFIIGRRSGFFLGDFTSGIFFNIVAAKPAAASQQSNAQKRHDQSRSAQIRHSASAGFHDS